MITAYHRRLQLLLPSKKLEVYATEQHKPHREHIDG